MQSIWHNVFFKQCCLNLNEIKEDFSIPREIIDTYNSDVLKNPMIVGIDCMFPSVKGMLSVMERTSENVFLHCAQKVKLNSEYPVLESKEFLYSRHEVDELLKRQVEGIKQKYGYKLLNVLDTDTYVRAIHQQYKNNTDITVGAFNKTEELYTKIKNDSELELLPFDDETTIAHVIQLFPLLEIKIREFAALVNIVPFKEKEKDFMKYKGPSSILREILSEVFDHGESLESVPDFLFIYNTMYNSNSLNIRNECVHGRDYISGNKVGYAFKIALLSIAMVMKRIDLIKANMEAKE